VAYVDRLTKEHNQRIRYSLTTNGSLLTENTLEFLDKYGFFVTLSFDGLAQDISRKKGTFDFLVSLIPRILARPGISLETNSVFSSETVSYLAESIEFIIRMGIRKVGVNLAHKPQWDSRSLLRFEKEVGLLRKDFACRFKDVKDVPWVDLCKELEEGVHGCPAGVDQMALSAQGTLWGCPVFPYYFADKSKSKDFRKYCFGHVDSFVKNPHETYTQKMANYSGLRMDCYETPERPCVMCPEIEHCSICPLGAALATDEIGHIPAWTCRAVRTIMRQGRLLLDESEKKARRALKKSCS
jgi:sulfatase maturation enzyme AslB (radical SAM superfamily)